MANRTPTALLLITLALLALVQQVGALYVTPIYGGGGNGCSQVNASYLACQDGNPISVAFSVSAPYAPIYGTFTAYPGNYVSESTPVNFYGDPCTVSSSTTQTCFVTLDAISPFMGNGTVVENASVRFVSSNYPQISFLEAFNVIVSYGSTPETSALVSRFTSENGTYTQMNTTFGTRCKDYQVCWKNVSGPLLAIGNTLEVSSNEIFASNLNAAYINLSAANESIDQLRPAYSAYVNTSDKVLGNVNKANYLLANDTLLYENDSRELNNCTFSNGTKYNAYIANSISGVRAYPMQNTVSGSATYLVLASNASAKETSLVKSCEGIKALLPAISFPSEPKGVAQYGVYVLIVAVVAFIAYLAFRVNDFKADAKWLESKIEAKKAEAPKEQPMAEAKAPEPVKEEAKPQEAPREEAKEAPKKEQQPAKEKQKEKQKSTPPAKQAWLKTEEEKVESEVSSLEDSFDSWLKEHIGSHEEAGIAPKKDDADS